MESRQMSPQKEQEIALKILERAELAQMTRQLKMGLSKVATPKKSSRDNARPKTRMSPVKLNMPPIARENTRVSPLKRNRADQESELSPNGAEEEHQDKTEPDAITRPSTPPRSVQKTRRRSLHSEREDGTDPAELAVPRTPISSRETNDLGADLLMYLATSPYTSAKSTTLQGPQTPSAAVGASQGKILTTPSLQQQQHSSGDAVRLSHIKNQPPSSSSSSSHFGFKVPNHTSSSTAHHETPSHSSSSQFSEIMDSPQVSFYMTSSSPRKRKGSVPSATAAATTTSTISANTQTLAVPGTPSRELRTAQLLATPNFNMGDYVHNLFSPSPRFTSGSVRDAKRE
ncbi:LANO_0E05006g1_1 [Lachancea nothofagi CBS 11611]|uniref:LANO_0E05006g1_1 n=1 Tax=Lachancea nothofagi CBS 11611 TaxID=1266666 RepID=A0A1G4JSP1_9SACH|nr:LANO_0E05006g1_1 [Lachancea nothofagi CBS 11611]